MTDRLGRRAPGPQIRRPVRTYGSARSSRRSYPVLVLRDEPHLAPRDLVGLIGFKRSNASRSHQPWRGALSTRQPYAE